MDLQEIIEKAKQELQALKGEAGKDKKFEASRKYANPEEAQKQFSGAVKRLLNLSKWTEESGIRAVFELYDSAGQPKTADKPAVGDHFKVLLPGIPLDNWMLVTDLQTGIHSAEFTAHPCSDPSENEKETTAHFFVKETSATFRVEVNGSSITAYQIGINEKINNHQEAGSRAIPNTLIAEAGWAGMQFIQWENLCAFWCGLKDADNQ